MEDSFESVFNAENLSEIFWKHIHPKKSSGVDRVSVGKFAENLDEHIDVIVRKCEQHSYRFTPYLQSLKAKGPNKPPREISIPCVRDRLVLKALTIYLHEVCSDCVAKDLPNTVVRKIKKSVSDDKDGLSFVRLDFSNFYGSINQQKLIEKLKDKSVSFEAISLIVKAISNTTVPPMFSKKDRLVKNEKGVPQGLAISNILAEIYMQDFDREVSEFSTVYHRFVDDVFVLCETRNSPKIWGAIGSAAKQECLSLNLEKSTEKGNLESLSTGFEFLGYRFSSPESISVRYSSYSRFLNSLIGRITRYRKEKERSEGEDELRKKLFVEELNERITGAIDENKRYGWVFFFCEVTDQTQLNQIDRVIIKMISGLSEINLEEIKRVSRARYEAIFSPSRGYIRDYNKFSLRDKIEFLRIRGKYSEESAMTEEQIVSLFNDIKRKNLSKLEADTATIS
ncbi:RNA-directed DNA polymerase [Thalassospira lucentensis]|uniref:RNA-directed DNA polymerase n=1 Tax=Thalassospira lucentensis TaxID=168935 RepID=UPI00142DCB38|nr:RNA-directed DNA polymerase [Thalassospira lucentensis]NIZ01905.1 RNA-directed DNA polymerase [Thalassospira lucentensis]